MAKARFFVAFHSEVLQAHPSSCSTNSLHTAAPGHQEALGGEEVRQGRLELGWAQLEKITLLGEVTRKRNS